MFVIFTLQGARYAFDLARIAAVAEPLRCWPIPGAPACYRGAVNFHGSIIAVIDLAHFMDVSVCCVPEKMIVLSSETSSLAFLVESVLRIAPDQEATLLDPPQSQFTAATLMLTDGTAALLDIDAMVSVAEKLIAR